MSDKNSNKVSLFIAVIAIILILGGVYLLNKSFSNSSKVVVASNAKSQIKTSSANTSSTKQTTKTDSVDTSVTGKSNLTPSDIAKDNKSTTTTSPTTTVNPSTSQSTTSTTKTESPKVTAETPKPLSENEIVAKFVGEGTGGLPKFEIQDCGNKNSKLCVNPNKFIINNASKFDVKLIEGNKYKFVAKYNEDQNFIIFEAIQSITEVK
jgi:hypothetical protein